MQSQRADAAARRALILDAADSVFGQHGVTAPLDLGGRKGPVGRATLYRNFPDRTALIEALLDRTVARIARGGNHGRPRRRLVRGTAGHGLADRAVAGAGRLLARGGPRRTHDQGRAADRARPAQGADTARDRRRLVPPGPAGGRYFADFEHAGRRTARQDPRGTRAFAGRALQLLRGGLGGQVDGAADAGVPQADPGLGGTRKADPAARHRCRGTRRTAASPMRWSHCW